MNRISALAIAKHQLKDLAPIWVGFGASYLLFITLPLGEWDICLSLYR